MALDPTLKKKLEEEAKQKEGSLLMAGLAQKYAPDAPPPDDPLQLLADKYAANANPGYKPTAAMSAVGPGPVGGGAPFPALATTPTNAAPSTATATPNDGGYGAAMSAVAAKMGGGDPFAKSSLQPGKSFGSSGTPAQKAEAAELAKVGAPAPASPPTVAPPIGTSGGGGPVSLLGTGLAATDKALAAQKVALLQKSGQLTPTSPTAGIGGGPSPAATKSISLFDKYLSPAEKAEVAHTLDLLQNTGQLELAKADAEAAGKSHVATLLGNYQDETETMAAEAETREQHRREVIDQYLATEETMAAEAAKTTIDSNKWWSDKDTGAQIATILGVALGGFASALTGGPNTAMQVVQASIDRDLATQKANLQGKYSALAAHRGLLAERVQEFGDERMAEQSARIAYAEQVQRQIQAYTATTESELGKANAAQMSLQLDAQITQYKDNLAKLVEQRAAAAGNAAAAAAAANAKEIRERNKALFTANLEGARKFLESTGGQGTITLQTDGPNAGMPVVTDLQGKVIWQGASGAGAESADIVTGINAKGDAIWGKAPAASKEAAGKLSETSMIYAGLQKDIADLAEMHKGAGEFYDTAAEKAVVESKLAAIQTKLAKLEGTPLRGDALTLLKAQLPTFDEMMHQPWLTSDPAKAKLEQLKKTADESYTSAKASKGAGVPDTLDLQKPTDEETEKD